METLQFTSKKYNANKKSKMLARKSPQKISDKTFIALIDWLKEGKELTSKDIKRIQGFIKDPNPTYSMWNNAQKKINPQGFQFISKGKGKKRKHRTSIVDNNPPKTKRRPITGEPYKKKIKVNVTRTPGGILYPDLTLRIISFVEQLEDVISLRLTNTRHFSSEQLMVSSYYMQLEWVVKKIPNTVNYIHTKKPSITPPTSSNIIEYLKIPLYMRPLDHFDDSLVRDSAKRLAKTSPSTNIKSIVRKYYPRLMIDEKNAPMDEIDNTIENIFSNVIDLHSLKLSAFIYYAMELLNILDISLFHIKMNDLIDTRLKSLVETMCVADIIKILEKERNDESWKHYNKILVKTSIFKKIISSVVKTYKKMKVDLPYSLWIVKLFHSAISLIDEKGLFRRRVLPFSNLCINFGISSIFHNLNDAFIECLFLCYFLVNTKPIRLKILSYENMLSKTLGSTSWRSGYWKFLGPSFFAYLKEFVWVWSSPVYVHWNYVDIHSNDILVFENFIRGMPLLEKLTSLQKDPIPNHPITQYSHKFDATFKNLKHIKIDSVIHLSDVKIYSQLKSIDVYGILSNIDTVPIFENLEHLKLHTIQWIDAGSCPKFPNLISFKLGKNFQPKFNAHKKIVKTIAQYSVIITELFAGGKVKTAKINDKWTTYYQLDDFKTISKPMDTLKEVFNVLSRLKLTSVETFKLKLGIADTKESINYILDIASLFPNKVFIKNIGRGITGNWDNYHPVSCKELYLDFLTTYYNDDAMLSFIRKSLNLVKLSVSRSHHNMSPISDNGIWLVNKLLESKLPKRKTFALSLIDVGQIIHGSLKSHELSVNINPGYSELKKIERFLQLVPNDFYKNSGDHKDIVFVYGKDENYAYVQGRRSIVDSIVLRSGHFALKLSELGKTKYKSYQNPNVESDDDETDIESDDDETDIESDDDETDIESDDDEIDIVTGRIKNKKRFNFW